MRYLVIDASLNGTGIRDKYEGAYIVPENLGLKPETVKRLTEWLSRYENEHYNGFENIPLINELDQKGKEIALAIKKGLLKVKVEYFSDARMTSETI